MKVQPAPVPTKRKMYVAYPNCNAQCTEAKVSRNDPSSDAAPQQAQSPTRSCHINGARNPKAYVSQPAN
ncbi:MAG TPA: hypothetical protein VIK80_13660 [Flavihumibacter sp.]